MIAMRWMVLCSVALICCGCSGDGGPANRRPTAPVKVTVTYKGAPVADATISFINQEGEVKPAFGKTDAQGVAKMKTYVEGDGALIGQHKVTIIKQESSGAGKSVDQSSPDYVPPPDGGAPLPTVKNLIPQKYSLLGSSGLTADVKQKGPNEIKFELAD